MLPWPPLQRGSFYQILTVKHIEKITVNAYMKLNKFFERLEKEFGLTPYDYCKIKPISYSTLKKILKGARPSRYIAQTIERMTEKRVTMKEMGFEADD